MWNPAEKYGGQEGDPIDEWAKPIVARGKRPQFEMEQVFPGLDPEGTDPFADPITESNDRNDAGDRDGAERILMDLCQADLRCLDSMPTWATWHSIGQRKRFAVTRWDFGLVNCLWEKVSRAWGWIGNRPFLRCMHGFGLCIWRLARFEEPGRVFDRMRWLNPMDNQGVRFLIDEVRAKVAWKDRRE